MLIVSCCVSIFDVLLPSLNSQSGNSTATNSAHCVSLRHPSGSIRAVSMSCPIAVVPIDGAAEAKLIADDPALLASAVPPGFYLGPSEATPSVGPLPIRIGPLRAVQRCPGPEDQRGTERKGAVSSSAPPQGRVDRAEAPSSSTSSAGT